MPRRGSLYPATGCKLGASLLALELGRSGAPAEYVTGFYSAAPGEEHRWVEVDGLLLDPTRDQFHRDPFAERYEGQYERTDAKAASEMEDEATLHLRFHWSANRRAQDAIREAATRYRLDLVPIEQPLWPFEEVCP